jgi:hypothetical protein
MTTASFRWMVKLQLEAVAPKRHLLKQTYDYQRYFFQGRTELC